MVAQLTSQTVAGQKLRRGTGGGDTSIAGPTPHAELPAGGQPCCQPGGSPLSGGRLRQTRMRQRALKTRRRRLRRMFISSVVLASADSRTGCGWDRFKRTRLILQAVVRQPLADNRRCYAETELLTRFPHDGRTKRTRMEHHHSREAAATACCSSPRGWAV